MQKAKFWLILSSTAIGLVVVFQFAKIVESKLDDLRKINAVNLDLVSNVYHLERLSSQLGVEDVWQDSGPDGPMRTAFWLTRQKYGFEKVLRDHYASDPGNCRKQQGCARAFFRKIQALALEEEDRDVIEESIPADWVGMKAIADRLTSELKNQLEIFLGEKSAPYFFINFLGKKSNAENEMYLTEEQSKLLLFYSREIESLYLSSEGVLAKNIERPEDYSASSINVAEEDCCWPRLNYRYMIHYKNKPAVQVPHVSNFKIIEEQFSDQEKMSVWLASASDVGILKKVAEKYPEKKVFAINLSLYLAFQPNALRELFRTYRNIHSSWLIGGFAESRQFFYTGVAKHAKAWEAIRLEFNGRFENVYQVGFEVKKKYLENVLSTVPTVAPKAKPLRFLRSKGYDLPYESSLTYRVAE